MKYCLFLCGMLISSFGFAQNSSEELVSDISTTSTRMVPESGVTTHSKISLKEGFATYYARKFEGRKTTSGIRYRGKNLTAAHLTLPFGTIVTVTNLDNGKTVDVVVNDRGPHSKKYMIDLSEAAAKQLGFFKKGQSHVEISYQLPDEES
ncbi:septal ring lytic transglycosylase RlpA family protein [Pedobacter sp. JCM 36344]|uniref:septal ring lytic transglycosylase RlpA family protein n=1 Tax=Pedobacter sp. JCM 36344 TaxID=3374280 RepID=UPI00397A0D6A